MKKNKEVHTELENIAPKLAQLKKREVFKVPEGYFVDLENIIIAGISAQETPKMMVPPSYFEQLTDNIMDKLQSEVLGKETKLVRDSKSKIFRNFNLISRWSVGIAASISILLISVYFIRNNDSNSSDFDLSGLETNEMLVYIEQEGLANDNELFHLVDFLSNDEIVLPVDLTDEELELIIEDELDLW